MVVSSNKRGRGKKSTYDPGTTPAVSTPYLNADELNAVDQGHKLMLTGSGLPGQAASFSLDRAADTIPSLIVGAVPELLPALPALHMASKAIRRKLKEKTGLGLNQSQQQAVLQLANLMASHGRTKRGGKISVNKIKQGLRKAHEWIKPH